MNTKRWELTEANKAKIPDWNRRWEQIIMSTAAMTDDDRRITKDAILGMYAAAKLDAPKAIVFVRSPIEAAIVAGAAAAWWHERENGPVGQLCSATDSATRSATRSVTDSATRSATDSATRSATYSATDSATRSATRSATGSATDSATRSATRSATYSAMRSAADSATDPATVSTTRSATDSVTVSATRSATVSATRSATDSATCKKNDDNTSWRDIADAQIEGALSVVGDTPFARQCITASWNMCNGGNEWASWCNYLSFVRDVVGFQHESHTNYKHYENATIHSGWRYMHAKFCIVSDRPCIRVTRLVGGVHQLHCETGPALAWRDGHERWYIEGFEVDQQIDQFGDVSESVIRFDENDQIGLAWNIGRTRCGPAFETVSGNRAQRLGDHQQVVGLTQNVHLLLPLLAGDVACGLF